MRNKIVASLGSYTTRYAAQEWLGKMRKERNGTPPERSQSQQRFGFAADRPPTYAVGLGEQPICATQKIDHKSWMVVRWERYESHKGAPQSGRAVLRSKESDPATYT